MPAKKSPESSTKRKTPDLCLTTLEAAGRDYLDKLIDGEERLFYTGLRPLDVSMRGVAPGELAIVAARPSIGKSLFLVQWLLHLVSEGVRCAFLSEEMTPRQLGKRMIAIATETPQEHWRDRIDKVYTSIDDFWKHRVGVLIPNKPCRSLDRACEVIDQLVERHKVEVVMLDYMQLLKGAGGSKYEEVSNISMALKNRAVEHNIGLVTAVQLNREIDKRKDAPKFSDLRDSGQIEQDCDVCVFLEWPLKQNPAHKPPKQYFVYVAKNRNRGTGDSRVELRIEPTRQRIEVYVPERIDVFDRWNSP